MLYSVTRIAAALAVAGTASAFSPVASARLSTVPASSTSTPYVARASLLQLSEAATAEVATEDCGCAEEGSIDMNGVSVSGTSLRGTVLADVTGARVPVSSLIGEDGKAVVVFLRHLGWPLCWDYALNWQSQAARMSAAGVAGPLFISVGRPDQLAKFLELNPELAQAKALIDDSSDFAGYRSAGFNYLMGDKELAEVPDFKPPKTMSMGKWFAYLKNVMDLSPIPKDKSTMKLGDVPPGVKVLGGTYAIDGAAVKFSHMDPVPGATPEIEEVLASVGA